MYKILEIENANLKMKLCSLGATLMQLEFPDKAGKMGNLVLGYPSPEDYLKGECYFGATVGRVANRIANASFEIDGKKYNLSKNEEVLNNHLHGGFEGFDRKNWTVELVDEENAKGAVFKYLSPDGQEGYEGNLDVQVSYLITDDNELVIKYLATSDKLTPCNLTHHSYFDLSQGKAPNIIDEELQIETDFYTPCDSNNCTTGEVLRTKGTALDFSELKKMSEAIAQNPEFFKATNAGLDHNFIVNPSKTLKKVATLRDLNSGIQMQVYTTELSMQVYTANFLDEAFNPTTQANYAKYAGVCLETQGISNSLNHKHYPSIMLKPNEVYSSTTKYSFSHF
ncbi:MAG: aldose epimerase family protein [Opitutales bacterium]